MRELGWIDGQNVVIEARFATIRQPVLSRADRVIE
jgi:hypothetical protein